MNRQVKSDSSLDYSDLVAELRSGEDGLEYAAADALEELMARIAALEAALKPFADAGSFTKTYEYSADTEMAIPFTWGDLRAARAAMDGKDGGRLN